MIHINQVTVRHGAQVLFSGANFQILPHSRIGLVGPNGAGKSTIFRLIVGQEAPDEGEVSIAKQTMIGYFSQSVGDMAGRSALEEVKAVSADVVRLGQEIAQMEAAMSKPMDADAMEKLLERYGEAMEQFEKRGGYDLEVRAQTILTGLGIGPDDYHRPVESFSGGWKMRIALARVLLQNPDVLLLDEPTNHLDVESIIWLEDWLLNTYEGALVMTSHDREFMNRLIKTIVAIENQTVTPYTGNYDFYEHEREIRKENLVASFNRQQEKLAKEEAFIARFKARASHAAQVQSRIKKIDKIERIEIPAEQRTVRFQFNPPPRSGDEVVKFDHLAKVWPLMQGGEKLVFRGASGMIRRGDKIAVVGVNGAGKSTFLKILAGQTEATSGVFTLGTGVNVGYFSQHAMETLSPNKSIVDTLQEAMPDMNVGVVRNLAAAFLFQGDEVEKNISILSGGEKSRVALAILLAKPLNFLILDEPTNHLDIQFRDILLGALKHFTGTVILVSHDRHFLRSLASRVFEIDRHELRVYEGDYDYYLWKTKSV